MTLNQRARLRELLKMQLPPRTRLSEEENAFEVRMMRLHRAEYEAVAREVLDWHNAHLTNRSA